MDKPVTQSFPSIKELISQSWDLCVKSSLNLFLLGVFAFFVNIFLMIFLGLIGLFFFLGGSLSKLNDPATLATILFSPAAIIYFVVCLVLFILITLVCQIAPILFIFKADERPKFFDIIKSSFHFIFPFLLSTLIVYFFVVGGFVFLVIPSLLFIFFFMFTGYEIILAGKKPWAAIKGSVTITTSHFGEILIRYLLYIFVIILVSFISKIIAQFDQSTYAWLAIVLAFVNIIFGWFGQAYLMSIYGQAKKITDETKPASMLTFKIVALLGWLIIILLAVFGIRSQLSRMPGYF